RDVRHDHRVGSDLGTAPDDDGPDHAGPRPDGRAALDRGMTLGALHGAPPEGDAVVEHDVIADLGGLADHYAHPVVDEEAPPDGGAGMDLDPRDRAGTLGDDQGRKPCPARPEPM